MQSPQATVLSWLTLLVVLGVVSVGVSQAMAQDQIAVAVSLNRNSIGLDESAILEVSVSGAVQDLPRPNMPALPMFEMYSQGQSSSISIVNGKVESSVVYRYLIMPQKAGTFPIDGIAVVYQNKRYPGNQVILTVLNQGGGASVGLEQQAQDKTGKSRDYFLEASVDNNSPYVNEQITLTLKFFIAVRYYGSPELAEPSTTGFWTEVLGNKAPYRQQLGNRTYRVIERKYALFPTQTGKLTIGPAVITATVAGTNQNNRDPFGLVGLGTGEEIRVRSQEVNVKVKPLPEAGRPADFTGTIGRFSMTATPSRTEIEVNQPVSVEFRFQGTGNIKSVAEPVIPELTDFRVYKASSNESVSKYNDLLGGVKTFEEVFIPRRPGTLEIPSLSFSYFDPTLGKYQTNRTRPIKLNVIKPEGYVADGSVPFAGPDLTIGSEARDIRYIKTSPGDLRPQRQLIIQSPLYLAVNAFPVAVLAAMVLLRVRRERLAADVGYARSRGASKQARRRLVKASKLAGGNDVAGFWSECSTVVLAFVADKLNISPHGLTSQKLATLLGERGADQGLIEDTTAFLDKCDFARYASGSSIATDLQQALKTAEDLMVRMEGVRF
jgi:hypothetical protein